MQYKSSHEWQLNSFILLIFMPYSYVNVTELCYVDLSKRLNIKTNIINITIKNRGKLPARSVAMNPNTNTSCKIFI